MNLSAWVACGRDVQNRLRGFDRGVSHVAWCVQHSNIRILHTQLTGAPTTSPGQQWVYATLQSDTVELLLN